MIVLDSSAAVDFLVGRAEGEWVEAHVLGAREVHAPHIIDVEIAGALARLVRIGDLTERRAAVALEDAAELTLTRYPHVLFLARMWELRDNVTAADAAYVALAEALDAPLVSTDRRLSRAPGVRATVVVP